MEIHVLCMQSVRDPVMLVQADAGGKGQIRTQAHEHAPPAGIVEVEVVLHHPALCDLQMPTILFRRANSRHDASRFSGFQDGYDLIRLRFAEYGSTNSSRRPSGASKIGAAHFSDRFFTQY